MIIKIISFYGLKPYYKVGLGFVSQKYTLSFVVRAELSPLSIFKNSYEHFGIRNKHKIFF